MPKVLQIGAYRFFFYSHEGTEPPHVHVRRERMEVKFWLEPVQLASNYGFAQAEVNRIRKHVVKNRSTLLDAWNDYFNA